MKFFGERSNKLFVASIICTVIIATIFIVIGVQTSGVNKILFIGIVLAVVLLVPLLGKQADKQGIYLDDSYVYGQTLSKKTKTQISDIEGIIIVNNYIHKLSMGVLVTSYDVRIEGDKKSFVYGMALTTNLSDVDLEYKTSQLFLSANRKNILGYAIFNQELYDELLRINPNIKTVFNAVSNEDMDKLGL